MDDEDAILSAEISGWPSKSDLANMLRADGYSVVEGKYSIRLEDFSHFVFQELGEPAGAGCISADDASVEALIACSSRVSKTLAKAGIRHRFEVYDGDEVLAAYFHHAWPKDS